MCWHRKLSQGGNYFSKKENIPSFSMDNSEGRTVFVCYTIDNLTKLSVELMAKYLQP